MRRLIPWIFAAGCGWVIASPAFGQQSGFSGFTQGNLVVTRSVYVGDSTTVTVGQALPPVCPTTAACGTGTATDNGAYPSPTSTNNVWNNDNADGSFGITSPIFLDQITPQGTLVNTLAIPTDMITTSFSSKSELSINLSADGTALTFVGYMAPVNTVDVSDANTPMVYDPTNPAGGSYFRAVAQVAANGAIQVTPTNSYSGNNGRAAILANGYYYMAGNANNGGGTPANVVASAGVQIATPGQTGTTPPSEIGNFSVTQVTNPATGMPYTADKVGKDNNFRGLTVFNNTLYTTKGSGSNGIDTVYQVGNAGTLPTPATASSTQITILPGFPVALAKTAGISNIYPFGIWFANANTLYVADEGDGVVADAAKSTMAGLQKWSLVSGTWQLDYVLQNGLNLGQQYTVANYPSSIAPATAGLRNLTGTVNSSGTVTLYAITSTVSANGDQGADPNLLVSITDMLSNTTAAGAANEKFSVLMSAPAGQVLRGVSFTPTASSAISMPLIQSSASPSVPALAPREVAFATGQNLTVGTPAEILGPLPTSFSGTTVTIVDSAGKTWSAPLAFVSPTQVTFQVPSGIATGAAKITVTGSATLSPSNVTINAVAPSLFTFNGSGLAGGYAIQVGPSGTQTTLPLYTMTGADAFAANPISLGGAGNTTYLVLFGTGLGSSTASNVTATIGGVNAPVLYAGPQGSFQGLDQVNLQIPASLAGMGNVNIQVTAGGTLANPVQITIH